MTRLLVFGANNYGQLMLNHTVDTLVPTELQLLCNVKSIIGGGGHTAIVDQDGRVQLAGWNAAHQVIPPLGTVTAAASSESGPTTREGSDADAVLSLVGISHLPALDKVACGWDWTVALSVDGEVFSWGSNVHGQQGVGTRLPVEAHFEHVSSAEAYATTLSSRQCLCVALPAPIVDIAAGLRHSVAVARDGRAFAWGAMKHGQLAGSRISPTQDVAAVAMQIDPEFMHLQPHFVSCAAGQFHTLLLDTEGRVWACGDNRKGQCGSDPRDHKRINLLRPVGAIGDGTPVRQVLCGWTHSYAIDISGRVLGWGRCDYGQLGPLQRESTTQSPAGGATAASDSLPRFTYQPRYIEHVGPVVQMSCGSEHAVALKDDGRVVAWGWGEHGILGTGEETNRFEPVKLHPPSGSSVSSVACGAGTSIVILKQ